MGKPVAPKKNMAMAFPDVCKTPTPGGPVPIPYPNIAQFANATGVSDESGKELLVGGVHVLLKDSSISNSDGDQAGSIGGVKSGGIAGECKIVQASGSVVYGPNKKGLARLMDQTQQNGTNANGFVLSADPTVLVGD
jgi:hypothetical protein